MEKPIVHKQVVIIGAGVGGLYLGELLNNQADWIILETNSHAGGYVGEECYQDSSIPLGPRMFVRSKADSLVKWADSYQIKTNLIPKGLPRYLLTQKGLEKVGPQILLKYPQIFYRFILTSTAAKEESFREFFSKKTGSRFFEEVIEPMAAGIWAGDVDKLSLDALWGSLKKRGLLKRLLKPKKKGMLVFDGGLYRLLQKTAEKWKQRIVYDTPALKITPNKKGVLVETPTVIYQAERCVCASSFAAMRQLALNSQWPGAALLKSMQAASLNVVSFYFSEKQIRPSGVGYLIPKVRGFKSRGVLFDADFNPGIKGDLLSVFIQNAQDPEREAFTELQKVLKQINPYQKAFVKRYSETIFQCHVGDLSKLQAWRGELEKDSIYLVGAYLPKVGVLDVIETVEKLYAKLELNRLFLTDESLI